MGTRLRTAWTSPWLDRYWCKLSAPREYPATGDVDDEWCAIGQVDGSYELGFPLSLPTAVCPPSD